MHTLTLKDSNRASFVTILFGVNDDLKAGKEHL